MKVTLFYADKNYTAHFKALAPGCSVQFGSGPAADFGVSGEGIAPLHFQILHAAGHVLLKQLASAKALVTVNGEPTSEAELRHGDRVVVGNTEVRLRIEGAPSANGETDAEDPAPAAWGVAATELPTGLIRWADESGQTEVADIIDRLVAKFPPLLMANFRLAEMEPPAWLTEPDGLLAGAPAELTATNSLHLIAAEEIPLRTVAAQRPGESVHPPQLGELLRLYGALRPGRAATLLFGSAAKDQLLEELKFHRGFFTSAQGLEMFLSRGSKDLAQKLLAKAAAVLVAGTGDAEWAVYSTPALAPTAEDLGLAAAPPKSPHPQRLEPLR